MSLHTIGTNANNSLNCLAGWSQVLLPADLAAISQSITDDTSFATILSGYGFGADAGLATGSTHATATLDTIASTGGAALSSIQVGDLVLGIGVVPGTYVIAVSGGGTSVTLSQAATGNAAGVRVAFVRAGSENNNGLTGNGGQLILPTGRGVIKVLPGDVVAVDNTGWPVLVSGAAIAYPGSQWSFV